MERLYHTSQSNTFNSGFSYGLLQNLLQHDFKEMDQFYEFDEYITLHHSQTLFLATSVMIIPFKMFQVLSHFEFFDPFKKLLASLYRILPHMLWTILIILICYMNWQFVRPLEVLIACRGSTRYTMIS